MKLITTIIAIATITVSFSVMAKELGVKKTVSITNNNGEEIGTVEVTEANKGVLIYVSIQNLPSGKHGMHFHERGDCSNAADFSTARGHIMSHQEEPHGFLHPEHPHEGDLPNIIITEDGTAQFELYSNMVTLYNDKANNKPALLDEDGSALIIHENEDDYKTQPLGNSGSRIACAAIIRD